MNRKPWWRWLIDRLGGRESGRRRELRDSMARELDGPHPPKTYHCQLSAGPGLRWRLRGDVSMVKALMTSRPYELVFEADGSHRQLVERGVTTEEELGLPFEPRARTAILSYRHAGEGSSSE